MSGASGSYSESIPKDLTPREFTGIRQQVASGIDNILESGGGPQFQGPFTADITGGELDALGQIQGFNDPSLLSTATDENLLKNIQGGFAGGNPFINDFIGSQQRQLQQNFDQNELLDRSLFSRSGQKLQESSPFSNARAVATRGLLDAQGDIATNVGFQVHEAERGRQQAAVNQQIASQQARFDMARGTLEASALPRLIEQFGIDAGREQFNRRMEMMMSALELGGQLGSPTIANEDFSISGSS